MRNGVDARQILHHLMMQLACSHLRVPEPNREAIKHWFDGVPMDSPRGAEQRAVVDPHHEPTARRLARHGAICAGPARCEHRRKQANPWGRLFGLPFWRSTKVTGPARPRSALVASQPRTRKATLVGSNRRRAVPALRFPTCSRFDTLTTSERHRYAACSNFKPACSRSGWNWIFGCRSCVSRRS